MMFCLNTGGTTSGEQCLLLWNAIDAQIQKMVDTMWDQLTDRPKNFAKKNAPLIGSCTVGEFAIEFVGLREQTAGMTQELRGGAAQYKRKGNGVEAKKKNASRDELYRNENPAAESRVRAGWSGNSAHAFAVHCGKMCYEKHYARYDAANECTAEIRAMLQACMDAGMPWKEGCNEETSLDGGVYTPSVVRAAIELRAHCELIYVLTKAATHGDQTQDLATSAEGGTLPPGIVAVGTALMDLTEKEVEDGFDAAESSLSWTHTNGAYTFKIGFAGLLIDEDVHRYIDVSDLPGDEGGGG